MREVVNIDHTQCISIDQYASIVKSKFTVHLDKLDDSLAVDDSSSNMMGFIV
jgi:hypothetical protein